MGDKFHLVKAFGTAAKQYQSSSFFEISSSNLEHNLDFCLNLGLLFSFSFRVKRVSKNIFHIKIKNSIFVQFF